MPHSLAAFVLVLPIASDPVAPPPREVVYYFPTKVGTKRVYEQGTFLRTETVTAVEEKDGLKLVTIDCLQEETQSGEKARVSWKMAVSKDGLFEIRDDKPDLEGALLKMPISPGAKWEWQRAIHPGDLRIGTQQIRRIVRGSEKVKVPAGTFDAIRVETSRYSRFTRRWGNPIETDWYAPGVGLVRHEFWVKGEDSWVLKSYTPAKE